MLWYGNQWVSDKWKYAYSIILIMQKYNSHASCTVCSANWAFHHPNLLTKLFFCSLNDFCFKKVDFLKAKIILGLTEIKTMHQNIVQVKYKAANESNKTDLIFFFWTQISGLEILK